MLNRRQFTMSVLSLLPVIVSVRANGQINPADAGLNKHLALARSATHSPSNEISNYEYLTRQVSALAYAADFSDQRRLSSSEVALFRTKVSDLVQNGVRPASDKNLANGAAKLSNSLTPQDYEELEEGFSLFGDTLTGGSVLMGLVSRRLSVMLVLMGLALPYAPRLVDKSNPTSPTMSDEAIAETFSALAREQAYYLYQDSPNARKLLDQDVFKDAFGIDFSASPSQQIPYLPEALQPAFEKIQDQVQQGDPLKQTQLQQIETLVAEQFSQQFAEWSERLKTEIIAALAQNEKQKIQARREQEHKRREVQGAIYLASYLSSQVFGIEIGNVISKVGNAYIQATALYSAFVAKSIGPIALTAGGLQIIQGLFGSTKDPNEVVLSALRDIGNALSTIREEMHERFNQVVANQERVLARFDEIAEALITLNENNFDQLAVEVKTVSDQINGLANYIETTDRLEWRSKVSSAANEARVELTNRQPNSQLIRRSMLTASEHALEVATFAPFTGKLTGGLSSSALISWINATRKPEHGVGLLPAIVESNDLSAPPNPYEFVFGASTFLQIFESQTRANNPGIIDIASQLEVRAKKVRQRFEALLSKENITASIERQKSAWERVAVGLQTVHEGFRIENGYPDRRTVHDVFPSELAPEFQGGFHQKVRVHTVRDMSRYNFLERETGSPSSYGEFFTMSGRDPLSAGTRTGLFDLLQVSESSREVWVRLPGGGREDAVEHYRDFVIRFNRSTPSLPPGSSFQKNGVGVRFSRVQVGSPPAGAIARVKYIPNSAHHRFGRFEIEGTQSLLKMLQELLAEDQLVQRTKLANELKNYLRTSPEILEYKAAATSNRYLCSCLAWLQSGSSEHGSWYLDQQGIAYDSDESVDALFQATVEDAMAFEFSRPIRMRDKIISLTDFVSHKMTNEIINQLEKLFATHQNGLDKLNLPELSLWELQSLGSKA